MGTLSNRIHVGTSGWHYAHWKGNFYPARLPSDEFLRFYASHLPVVELNNTFYRLPEENAVAHWRDDTPQDFRFAVKGSRFLTHMKKLKDPAPGLERFFSRIDALRPKIGPILFQLPPHWTVDEERLRNFLHALPKRHRYSFEFRDPSWNTNGVLQLLADFQAAYCIFDLAGFQSPHTLTTDFTYIRLHGPGARYQGSYEKSVLRAWVERVRKWNLRSSYVFFDNDQAAYAVKNAIHFRELLES